MTAWFSDTIQRDLRQSLRSLRRTPAFTVTAILILGLGIGMASAMFTVFQSVVLRNLPVREQDRIVTLTGMLGATPNRVRQMVLGEAFTLAGIGAAVGLAGALAGSRLLTTMLFEVSPTDPVTLVGVPGLLLGVALLAAYLPARRATKIDPARALRAD
jgi:ABC-type lipoprotein release transport system permease subunit